MPSSQQTHITTFTQSDDEWWTPQWLIDESRTVLKTIDLDPASTPDANRRVGARYIYGREENGLEQKWFGKVFLNPPSKRGDPAARPHLWAKKLSEEYTCGNVKEFILVVKSVLGYNWYEDLYRTYWVCHLRERPAFIRPSGEVVGRAKKGVSIFYGGPNPKRFLEMFGKYGRVIPPLRHFSNFKVKDHLFY